MGIALCILRFDSIAPIAFAMVVAALPAFGFGVRQAFSPAVLKIGNHARRFFLLMFKSAVPYAVAGIASFAYLPVGLYTASHAAGPEFLGSYNFAHKLVTLASGLMVYFISSSLISLHQTDSRTIHLRDIGIFMLFIATVSTPFTLFPEWSLQIIFFAAPWTDQVLGTSSTCLRILSISLILQALRMSMISTLLKERRMQLYCTLIVLGGILNIIVCYYGSGLFKQECIPALALSGDVFLTIAVTLYFTAKRRIHW
jgi:Na+-driven multidrug efflux pump